jgi:branched-chain amino acid transport system substrate-binding protein
MLAIDAIVRANSAVPEDIKNALSATVNFEGVTGYITIDENGRRRKGRNSQES